MKWLESKNPDANNYALPGDWLKIEYFEALNILFRVENSLRVFVFIILKKELQSKWKDLSVTSDDDENSTISAIAKRRIVQDKNYAYLGYALNSPLLHLTSGELIRIITSEAYWRYFKIYFPGSKEIMRNKLDEIGNVRNCLAHFRPIKKGDIDLVKQNAIHTLTEIEKTLIDFITCTDSVPTNTEHRWYMEIKDLNFQDIKLIFNQSKKIGWVKIGLVFTLPIFDTLKIYNVVSVACANIKTDKILSKFGDLSTNVISVTESNPTMYREKPEVGPYSKIIYLTYSLQTLENNYAEIKDQISQVLNQATQEIELIKNDNLARGSLIEIVRCKFKSQDKSKYYQCKDQVFKTDYSEDTAVEFWGTMNKAGKDFVTNTSTFPWMPVDVSEDKDPPF